MIDNTDKNFEPDDTAASSYDGGARTETTDDVLVDGLFGKQNGAGKENAGRAQNAQNGNARFPRDAARRADAQSGAQKQSFSEQDVMALCTRISSLMDKSRFEDALSIVFSLRGDARRAVRDNLSVTIPMGSRDGDLRGIAAGALVQSYLELGKIVRRDIEEKLFAIIESSEPEYDEDDEIIEQTPDDILYKVTACVIFMCVMCEASGNHPNEKSALYDAGDSILDLFLSDHLDTVMKKNKRRITVLGEAIRLHGGTVGEKLGGYIAISRRNTDNPIMKYLGEKTSFRVTAGILAVLCLISVIVYLRGRSSLLSFIATDNVIMMFIIGAEIFFTVGLVLLAVLIASSGNLEKKKKRSDSRNQAAQKERR